MKKKRNRSLPVPPRSGRLAMLIIDESGTAERIVSLNGRVERARPADERDVDLRCWSDDGFRPVDPLVLFIRPFS